MRPPRTQTPAYCCAPSGHGRRGASSARARCLVALSQHAAKPRPRRSPLRFPGRGKKREGRTAPAPGRDTRSARGVPQLHFNYWQGKEEAAAQEDSWGSSGLGNREGWSVNLRREARRAHWTEPGGQDRQECGAQGGKREAARQQGRGRAGRRQDLGREGRTDGPKSWGRRAPRGVGGRGAACQAGRSWEASRQASRRARRGAPVRGWGGSRSEKAKVGRGHARCVGETRGE